MRVEIGCDRESFSTIESDSNVEAVIFEKHLKQFCRVYVVVHNQNSLS